jgi:hypothetical protein
MAHFEVCDLIVYGVLAGFSIEVPAIRNVLDVWFYRRGAATIQPDKRFIATHPTLKPFQDEPGYCVLPSTSHCDHYRPDDENLEQAGTLGGLGRASRVTYFR